MEKYIVICDRCGVEGKMQKGFITGFMLIPDNWADINEK